jgi:hypothetical protein
MNADRSRTAPAVPSARTSRIECTLGNDARLMASLGAVLTHAARRAGLPEVTQEDVAAAAFEALRETLSSANGKGSGASTTRLVVEEFSDRVEIAVDCSAGATAEGTRKRLEGRFSDRVRCEGREGQVHITLLKPCAAKSSSTA